MIEYNIGDIYKNIQNCEFVIKETFEDGSCKIEFIGYDGEILVTKGRMESKTFKNPYLPSVFNIGYLGIGKHKAMENGKFTYKYSCWKHMMERAYDKKYHDKFPTYKNVTTCNEWHSFQNFAEWFSSHYIEGFHLDKDLLQQGIKNKIYSPETCIFIPDFLNYFIQTSLRSTNTSGYIGVTFDKPSKKWMVTIFDYERKINKNMGRYKNIEDAVKVYTESRAKMAELVKERTRSLNIFSEDIIKLIK